MSEFKEIKLKARVLKSREEVENMMKKDKYRNYTEDDFLIIARGIDKETFQPQIFVALKEPDLPLNQWMMFYAPVELVVKEDTK